MKNLSIPIAIIIAGIIVGIAIYSSNKESKPPEDDNQIVNKDNGQDSNGPKAVSNDDHILGNPEAPITIIEFSDTECPFCKRFHPIMQQIMEEYGKDGKVKWVYRHFPIDQLHKKARKEAEATECAGELGGNEKFWEYLDRLFEITPSNDGLDPAELPNIAEYVGLDRKQFEECLSSGKYAQHIEDDYQDGLNSGVRGTPHSIVINEKGEKIPIQGSQSYTQVKAIVDQLLETR